MESDSNPESSPSGPERTFACEECINLSFGSSEELNQHMRTVHGRA